MKNALNLITAMMAGALVFSPAASAGVVVITQAGALAGGVTPGDAPGFPVSITASGSYALGGNLDVTAGVNGVNVTSVDTTIDLQGFKIDGGGEAASGIYGTQRSLTIRRGTIRGFLGNGFRTLGALARVEDMRIEENKGTGVAIAGIIGTGGWARIVNNVIFANGQQGISCVDLCHVQGNFISNNGSSGVAIHGGTVLGNTIAENGNRGILATSTTGFGNNTLTGNVVQPVGGPGPRISFRSNLCGSAFC